MPFHCYAIPLAALGSVRCSVSFSVQHCVQLIDRRGLHQVGRRAASDGLGRVGRGRGAGQHHDRHRAIAQGLLHEIHALAIGQGPVQDQYVRPVFGQAQPGFAQARGGGGGVALQLQKNAQRLAGLQVVIDDDGMARHGKPCGKRSWKNHPCATPPGGKTRPLGTRMDVRSEIMANAVPPPGVFSRQSANFLSHFPPIHGGRDGALPCAMLACRLPAPMTTPDTAIDTDLLPRLRRCTSPLHDDIEALLQLESPMPLDRYGRILRGFHEFLQLWELRVRHALPEPLRPWFDARVRAPLAARDIAALALPDDPALRAAARAAQHRLRLDSPAAAIGSLYVIEGSALGGQVLTPKLRALHGLTPERGGAYFHGFGDRTGAMWREFRQLAQAEAGGSAASRTDACRAAVQTFKALIETFEPIGAPAGAVQ